MGGSLLSSFRGPVSFSAIVSGLFLRLSEDERLGGGGPISFRPARGRKNMGGRPWSPFGPGVRAKDITSAYPLLARTWSQGRPNRGEAGK